MTEDGEETDWEVPKQAQPNDSDVSFDLDQVLSGIVLVRAEVPDDAFTAQVLGTERTGNGVVIDESGLILTVGYVVTEADKIWLTANDGSTVRGDLVSYDHETGFGLLQALGSLRVPAVSLGLASKLEDGDSVIFAAAGGRRHSLYAHVASRRPFVGSWEYALDEAVFTVPVHPNWAGAGVIDITGKLVGIGSLFVQNAGSSELDGNMSIPIDLYKPISDSMRTTGSSGREPRPWLGLYLADGDHSLAVAGMVARGPAAGAGLKVGDEILEVGNEPVSDLHKFYRSVWALGSAGIDVPLKIRRDQEKIVSLSIRSADRRDLMRKPKLHS